LKIKNFRILEGDQTQSLISF